MRVLCLNAGSSTLKAAGFVLERDTAPVRVVDHVVEQRAPTTADGVAAVAEVFDTFARAGFTSIDAVAHRLVHGGPTILEHVVIDDGVRVRLEAAVPFAPLHLPAELAMVDAAQAQHPRAVQVACLDTAFHRQLPSVARRLPVAGDLDRAGVRRYGFHGLSFEYLVDRLGPALGARAVLAHLGNGASLAAVRAGVGVDTTMGFTPSGGLVMGTRTGDLDPGVVVHLVRTRGLDADALERVVDHESGLLGISERSSDVRDLLAARDAGDERAALALDVYQSVAAKHVAAMTIALGGLDTLVFTGGVGEHAGAVRAGIAGRLSHLGVMIDPDANGAHAELVSPPGTPVAVRVVPTDEEAMMARHACRLVEG